MVKAGRERGEEKEAPGGQRKRGGGVSRKKEPNPQVGSLFSRIAQ